MADRPTAFGELLRLAAHARPEDLPRLAMRAAVAFGLRELVLYVVDYQQRWLLPLPGPKAPAREPVAVEGTLAGRTFTLLQVHHVAGEDGHRVWLPLLDGTERLGVLEVTADRAPSPLGEEDLAAVAQLLAGLLATRRGYGDLLERTRRRLPMQLAAEIIWNLLPPLSFATPDVTIAAVLEPCYEVGGDAFDYAINDDVMHLAIFDAVGHGIEASSMTSLAINAYRNARRTGLDLSDTYRSIDKWVAAQHPGGFVTAVLGELDIATGRYRRIAAGHPGELLLREGRLIAQFSAPTAAPLGLGSLIDPIPGVDEQALQPGDQVLLFTDGVVEARSGGEFFGIDRLVAFVTKAVADQLPGPETLRRLIHAVLGYQHDSLQDDASALLLRWRPGIADGSDTGPPPHGAP